METSPEYVQLYDSQRSTSHYEYTLSSANAPRLQSRSAGKRVAARIGREVSAAVRDGEDAVRRGCSRHRVEFTGHAHRAVLIVRAIDTNVKAGHARLLLSRSMCF